MKTDEKIAGIVGCGLVIFIILLCVWSPYIATTYVMPFMFGVASIILFILFLFFGWGCMFAIWALSIMSYIAVKEKILKWKSKRS